MTSLATCSRLLALIAVAVLASAECAAAQSVEQFYRGRSINFLVASAPGGINDLVARLMSRHLGNHIP
jgi:tripartite-type tricarboxylate transporter receptor subunit TctC